MVPGVGTSRPHLREVRRSRPSICPRPRAFIATRWPRRHRSPARLHENRRELQPRAGLGANRSARRNSGCGLGPRSIYWFCPSVRLGRYRPGPAVPHHQRRPGYREGLSVSFFDLAPDPGDRSFQSLGRLMHPPVITQGVAGIPSGNISYTRAGQGPVILLVHGLGGTRDTWNRVVGPLARTNTVIAPDLPGHGASDAPAGDYSLGAHAAALRDLLVLLQLPTATVVGHSLGGGVAMQFAYQFLDRVQRLVLISSGGLGPEVAPVLRMASSVPGADVIIRGLASLPRPVIKSLLSARSMMPGAPPRSDVDSLLNGLGRLGEERQRRAFIRTARSVIDWHGQSVSATRQLESVVDLPLLLIWGRRDRTIPPHHHTVIAHLRNNSRALELPEAGHFPHETDPDAIVAAIRSFVTETEPFKFDERRWRSSFPGAPWPRDDETRTSSQVPSRPKKLVPP